MTATEWATSKGLAESSASPVIVELEGLIRLLESEIPASPHADRNAKLEAGLKSELARYFKGLAEAFPYDALEQLYYSHVKQE
jgi:hypothetical protein